MIAGEWKAYPARVLLAALAIAIGVALGFAVHLINTSALTEFDRAIRTVNGDADLQVRAASAQGFDERLYPRLARLPGLAGVSPAVELQAEVGGRTPITLVGLDVLRAAAVTPSLVGRGSADPFDDKALYLSPAALRDSGRRIGDTIPVTAAGHAASFTVAGELAGVEGEQRIGVIDIAAAQWRFGQLGRLQRIDLRLAEGADPAKVSAAIAAVLPAGAEIATRASEERRSDSLSRAYRVNLDMLALVALLTGGFLVYSAQSLSVARRRPQFALLRVLGVNRRALLTQILTEAAAVGGLGALAGLLLGLGLAAAALRLLGGDLGGGYFRGAAPHLSAAPGPAAIFGALGLAVALVGSLLPAREAAAARPAVALKNLGDVVDPQRWPPVWPAAALLAAGAAAAFAPAIAGLPILGYLSIALMLACPGWRGPCFPRSRARPSPAPPWALP
jgi:putative ABC transport system permease protein